MVLVYKSLHRLAQPYLSDDCQLVTDVGRRHLRSADNLISTHVRSYEHSQGSAIEVLGSPDHGCGTVCLVPAELRQQHIFLTEFRRLHLRHFCSMRLGALWLLCFSGAVYKHSYLLTYNLCTTKCAMISCGAPGARIVPRAQKCLQSPHVTLSRRSPLSHHRGAVRPCID